MLRRCIVTLMGMAGLLNGVPCFAGKGGRSDVAPPDAVRPGAMAAQFVGRYLAADWGTLEADMAAHAEELAALPREQAADMAAIRQALAECRPAWWGQIQASNGKKVAFRPMMWGRATGFTYDPALKGGSQFTMTNSVVTLTVNWPISEMASLEKAEHGFTKGDLADMGMWQTLEAASAWSGLATRVAGMNDVQKAQFQNYLLFRGNVAAAYYGTPRTRRWAGFLSCDAFNDRYSTASNFVPRKPFGAMVVAEIVGHPWRYPSVKIPAGVAAAGGNIEQKLAANFMGQFERTVLTLAEDKALREAARGFEKENGPGVLTSGKIALFNKLAVALDPAQDAGEMAKRNGWLGEQLAHPATAAVGKQGA